MSADLCTTANKDHSITSSARARSVGGTSIPSAFAVFRLMTSSNLTGCSTGRSAGFAPLKISDAARLPLRVAKARVQQLSVSATVKPAPGRPPSDER